MELRQLFDRESCTYTYLLVDGCSRRALLIDPVVEQAERDAKLVAELGLTLDTAVDTHVHADHVTGLAAMKVRTKCRVGVSAAGGAEGADFVLRDGDTITVGTLSVRVLATPGHTDGCVSYYASGCVFTGDALLVRGCGRTDFQSGNPETLYDSVTGKLFALPDATIVYPGHDYNGFTTSTIGEEKRLNPRLTKSRGAFADFMRQLKLAEPKKIAEAVPANLRIGYAPR